MIPMFFRLVAREEESNKRGVNIWLPLFLLWILLLPLFVLLIAIWLCSRLAALVTQTAGKTAKILEAGAAVIWNMKGLQVNICNQKSRFVLHF